MSGKRWNKVRRRRLARRYGYCKVYSSYKKDCAGVPALWD